MMPVRRRLEMPFLLLCGMGLSALFAGVGVVAYAAITIGALFGNTFTFNGQAVSRAQFWHGMWPFFVAYPLVLAGFGIIALALWKERRWAREAIMALWAVAAAAEVVALIVTPEQVPGATIVLTMMWLACCWGTAALHLYGKANVHAYYEALRQHRALG